jgi:hypothetical protein
VTTAVRHLMAVDVRSMAEWISAIPFEAWPQQTRLEDGKIRPAMVNDLRWPWDGLRPSFRDAMGDVVDHVNEHPGLWGHDFSNFMLSVVMPRHSIPPHADQQSPGWITRVHVPLLTNPWAFFDVLEPERRRYQMEVGNAYLVDVSQVHEVVNHGATPRVHFMFDVFGGSDAR